MLKNWRAKLKKFEPLMSCKPLCVCPPTATLLMDLYDISGGRLDVIAEEVEHQELSRESTTTMESSRDRGGRVTQDVSTFQRFSVNTNESLRFEPCDSSTPSPTGAEDGLDDEDDDDVFKEGDTEVGKLMQSNAHDLWIFFYCIQPLFNKEDFGVSLEEPCKSKA